MALLFGLLAIIATGINLFLYMKEKDYKLAMALALAFTALTLVAEFRQTAGWVKKEDWAALADVLPTMELALWILTIIAILLNVLPIILEFKSNKKIKTMAN